MAVCALCFVCSSSHCFPLPLPLLDTRSPPYRLKGALQKAHDKSSTTVCTYKKLFFLLHLQPPFTSLPLHLPQFSNFSSGSILAPPRDCSDHATHGGASSHVTPPPSIRCWMWPGRGFSDHGAVEAPRQRPWKEAAVGCTIQGAPPPAGGALCVVQGSTPPLQAGCAGSRPTAGSGSASLMSFL